MNSIRIAQHESLEVDVELRPMDISATVSEKRSSFSMNKQQTKGNTQMWCSSYDNETHNIPLLLVLIATAFTFEGSWDCNYFRGATTGLSGKNYGIWTLQGIDGTCQPWDTLFSSGSLDNSLAVARAFSMTAMILGLSLLAAMSQALRSHFVSWGVGAAFFVLFNVSLLKSQKFNVWALFFLLLYIVLVLIVRTLSIHRAVSSRFSKCIAWLLILNSVFTMMTLLVLDSNFCQCNRLDNEKLDGRMDPTLDPCDNQCTLGPAGVTVLFGAAAWLLAGLVVLKLGVQQNSSEPDGDKDERVRIRMNEESDSDEELSAENEDTLKMLRHDDDFIFKQTCLQKICCYFFAITRTRKETTLIWCIRFALVAVCVVFALVLLLLVGSRYENAAAARLPSTTLSFVTNVVCSFNPLDPSVPFTTYPSPEAAKANGMTVAHCGPCAYCSNLEDIKTYVTKRDTITKEAKKCGKTAVLGTTDELHECLEDRIGLSYDCRTCWVENMECDAKLCIMTCIETLFTGFMKQNNVPQAGDEGWLNRCLQCDERRCGTAFVTCSGAARRRLGIRSDIERNPGEICPHVEFDWDKYRFE